MSDGGDNSVASPGGGVGGRVARLVADATVYTRQRMGPHQNQVIQKVLADFTNHVSDEIRGVLGPLWKQFADDENTPAELRPFFKALETERGQAFAWLGGNLGSAVIGSGLSAILNNMMAPLAHRVLAGDPNSILGADVAARLDVMGFGQGLWAQGEAARNGIDANRYGLLKKLASRWMDTGDVIELWRRGELDRNDAHASLRRLGFDGTEIRHLEALKSTVLTPEQLAAMWNRSIVSTDEGARIAAQSGMSAGDFRKLTELGGDPLPPADLGEAFRRGFIDRERFNRGIIQGPLRNEWFDVLEKLQYRRMSPDGAADAVNQGHMTEREGRAIAEANGLDPNDFSTLLVTAGQPPGIEFAAEAYNRELITDREYDTMFLESRIKNRYLPLLRAMRTRIIPQETVRLLYREGVYSREDTLRTLMQHGFTADDASALVALEESRGEAGTRELTRAQIVEMYEERILSLGDTTEFLLGLGYSEHDARAMIELADLRRMRKFVNAAITRIRSGFISGKLTESAASTQLDRFGVPVGQRDDMLALWDIDRTTVSKTLTASQVRQAWTKDLITRGEAVSRLVGQGYASDDAELYLELTS